MKIWCEMVSGVQIGDTNPVHFIKTQKMGEALIRESIQNSLDARDPLHDQVVVEMRKAKMSPTAEREQLRLLLGQVNSFVPDQAKQVRTQVDEVLLIEDFGTTGLRGYGDPNTETPYGSFWLSEGLAKKRGGGTNGRWGLGKTTFAIASGVKGFVGYSVCLATKQKTLLGRVIVSDARKPIQGVTRRFNKDFFFAKHEADPISRSSPEPITNPQEIQSWVSSLGFRRKDEAGLSIAVISPIEIDEIRLADWITEHYAIPILRGRLEVGLSNSRITAGSLKSANVARFEHAVVSGGHVLFDVCPNGAIENKEQLRAALTAVDWLPIRQKIDAEEMVCLRVRFSAVRAAGANLGFGQSTREELVIDVYVRATKEVGAPRHLAVRGDITAPNESKRLSGFRQHDVCLMAEAGSAASDFLGDAEGPAHEDWTQTDTLKSRWLSSRNTLIAIHALYEFLPEFVYAHQVSPPRNALEDFFSSPEPGGAATGKKKINRKVNARQKHPRFEITSSPNKIVVNGHWDDKQSVTFRFACVGRLGVKWKQPGIEVFANLPSSGRTTAIEMLEFINLSGGRNVVASGSAVSFEREKGYPARFSFELKRSESSRDIACEVVTST